MIKLWDKISKLVFKPLSVYDTKDYNIRKKVKVLYLMLLSIGIILPINLTMYIKYQISISPEVFNISKSIAIVCNLLAFILLLKGRHQAAGHLLLINCFLIVWGIMFTEPQEDPVQRLDTIMYIFAILSLIPILVTGKRRYVAIYFLLNYGAVWIFTGRVGAELGLTRHQKMEYIWDYSFSTLFALISAVIIFTLNNNALKIATLEIEKNNKLNWELEKRVSDRTAKLEIFKTFVDASNQGLGMMDERGHIIFINKALADLMGLRNEVDAVGGNFKNFYPPEVWEQLTTIIFPHVMQEGSWKGRFIMKKQSGLEILTENNLFIMEDQKGKRKYIANAVTDITDWINTMNELKEVNRQVKETSHLAGTAKAATGALHNVGNIVNSINIISSHLRDEIKHSSLEGLPRLAALLEEEQKNLDTFFQSEKGASLVPYIQLLGEKYQTEKAKNLEQLDMLMEKVEHMAEVIRIQQGMGEVKQEVQLISIDRIIRDVLRMEEAYLHKQDILSIFHPSGLPQVPLDKSRVLQILSNLVHNAAQAFTEKAREKRWIKITACPAKDKIKIEIEDNGKGIPLDLMDKIFNYGFTTKKEGHGYGLYYCRKTARDLGGDLVAFSDGEGLGALFILELPYKPETTVKQPPAHS